MKETLIEILNFVKLAFWVEIITDNPKCTYYFGPFLTKKDAELAHTGYIEDLKNEGAIEVSTTIKRVKPSNLTIFDEVMESKSQKKITQLKSQLL